MNPSRRELLASLLGLPAALSAGCQSQSVPLPPGEIVGTSDVLGHRLRDGWRPVPANDAWQRHPIVIVGGGVAGLAAAWRLHRAGVRDFVLLELEAHPGGTARSGVSPVGGYPWGAHYIPAPFADDRALSALLDEMGAIEGREADGTPIIAEQVLCRDPEERVFFRGRWYEGLYLHVGEEPSDVEQFQRFQKEIGTWAEWRDGRGRRAFAVPMAHGSDDPVVKALDRMTMTDWMGQHDFTSSRLHWLVDYSCRDDYGTKAEHTSAWAGLFYFASRLKTAGAEAQPLMTWPEGNGRPVAHMFDRVRDRVRLGWAAADVNPTETGVEIVAVNRYGEAVHGLRANQVIVAAPQFLVKHLVRPWRQSPPSHLSAFEYGSWMVANLHLQNRPADRGYPLAWDNVIYESPSLGYVVNTHQIGNDDGPTIFTYYLPLCDADVKAARSKLLGTDRDGWADAALTDLTMAHADIRSLTTRLDIMRWGHAMVRPSSGFIWGGDRVRASKPFRGIHFAGADLSGVPLFEEALYHGVRAAEEVLTVRQIPFESLLGGPAT